MTFASESSPPASAAAAAVSGQLPVPTALRSWVITGGMGCGKSSVSRLLARLLRGGEEAYFSADAAVQRLLDTEPVLKSLGALFGPQAVREEGGRRLADRGWLREHVFSDSTRRKKLEEILHPEVLAELESARKAAQEAGENLFLAEVPLHYEIGGTVSADLILVVAASPEVQKRRLMERRGLDDSIIEQMLRAQWPIEAKVERADVVIWNDGDLNALEAQVLTLARQHWQA